MARRIHTPSNEDEEDEPEERRLRFEVRKRKNPFGLSFIIYSIFLFIILLVIAQIFKEALINL